jgi:hypothetical protein
MAKRQNTGKTIEKTQIIVAVIAAVAAIIGAYWQFVWKPAPGPTPQIEYVGRVLDSTTETPVRGAKVALYFKGAPLIVYTDSEGIYRFTIEGDKLAGQVKVEATGYHNYDRNVTLRLNSLNIEDIRLQPLPTPISQSANTPATIPTPEPDNTLTPTPVLTSTPILPSPTPNLPPQTPVPPTVTSTYTPVPPTLTPTLIQFSINTPSPTNTILAEPAPTIMAESASINEMVAPILETPSDGDSKHTGFDTTFEWKWDGELLQGQGFEILVWQGDETHFGAFDARDVTSQMKSSNNDYQITRKLEGAYSVTRHGSGEYMWAVAVVKLDPYERIIESSPRRLRIDVSGGGGGGGGKPVPTPAPP